MTAVAYLDLDDLLLMVRALDTGPVRDIGLLDSSAARPRSTAFGVDAYPTLAEKAAALLHSLTRNHALVDGNKRLALLATTVFLDLNSAALSLSDDEAFDLVMDVSSNDRSVADIAARLRVMPTRPGLGG